jgi:hypothetical protein
MTKNKKTAFVLWAALCATALAGCSDTADREQIASDIQELSTAGETATDSNASAEDIPEHIEYVIGDSSGKQCITVDADVYATTYNHMGVYQQEKARMTEDEIKAVAENLFDNGEYEVEKPYWMMSHEEISTFCEDFRSIFYTDDTLDTYDYIEASEYLNSYDFEFPDAGLYYGELTEGQLLYPQGDTGLEECRLRGLVDGEEWEFRYISDPYVLSLKPVLEHSGYMQGLDNMESAYGENLVNYQDAQETAYNSLYRLGITDMTVKSVRQIGYTQDGKYIQDGYLFTFTKQCNGNGQASTTNACGVFSNDSSEEVSQEYAIVAMGSNGFYWTYVYNRYENAEVMTDNSSLLSFSQVNEIAQDYFTTFNNTHEGKHTINKISLEYMTVSYDDKYVLMPFWVYYGNTIMDSDYDYNVFVGINAIDGSIVTTNATRITELFRIVQ